ncbi:hypothetical protein ACFVXH_39805 [Kitasatospora sp. NPDC058184]|uniref:hypothetical protein n=1 Tax=Kitasatospora sp. NPDC058184 TaxID=3346370 RepID=UPI0036D8B3CF
MQHHILEKLGRLLPLNPDPGGGTVYAALDSPCLIRGAEAGSACACSIHFGHRGDEWVLHNDGEGNWTATGTGALIPLGYIGEDPAKVAQTVLRALPPEPRLRPTRSVPPSTADRKAP